MALVIADRVRETTTTTGTGTLTLAGPYTGFQAFSVIGNGNTTYYAIIDASTGAWEVGIGTYTSSGNTLSRDTILSSSNSGSAVNFGAGTKDVILTQPSERAVVVQSAGSGLQTGVASFTANGVPYANSTSTLTTGSALQFSGTYLQTLGGTGIQMQNAGATANWFFETSGLNLSFTSAQNGAAIWSINGSEQMRLTSTGLGIGTSSPSQKLHVYAASGSIRSLTETGNTSSAAFTAKNSGESVDYGVDSTGGFIQVLGAKPLLFYTNATERMRLDSSGNLGLGATPSAVGAYKIMEINGTTGGILYMQTAGTRALQLYGSSGESGLWMMGNGALTFATNNTERARIDSSGNLGIGTTSTTNYILRVNAASPLFGMMVSGTQAFTIGALSGGGGAFYYGAGNVEAARIDGSGNFGLGVTPSAWISGRVGFDIGTYGALVGNNGGGVSIFYNSYRSASAYVAKNTGQCSFYDQGAGNHYWYNSSNTSITGGATWSPNQAMTLDASGTLLIGRTSGVSAGARIAASSTGDTALQLTKDGVIAGRVMAVTTGLAFGVDGADGTTERARIDSSGNLGIGTSSPVGKVYVNGTDTTSLGDRATAALVLSNLNGVSNGRVNAILFGGENGNTNSAAAVAFKYTTGTGNGYGDLIFATRNVTTDTAPTERMRITAAGLVGIGTSSPNRLLTMDGGNADAYLKLTTSATGSSFASGILFNNPSNGDGNIMIRVNADSSALQFYTGGSERARIDSSGNLLVGSTSSPSTIWSSSRTFVYAKGNATNNSGEVIVESNNGNQQASFFASNGSAEFGLWSTKASALLFGTNNAERARITSGGYFKASNTGVYDSSTASYHELDSDQDNTCVYVKATNASLTTTGVIQLGVSRNTTNNTFYAISYYNGGAAAYKFRVADSGDVTNTNGTYGTISDAKMKTDIVDAGSQWSDIKALRFRKFKMKNDPSGLVQLGVVAQEVELTSPGLVDEHADKDAEGNDLGTTTKSVKTSVLLMKAAVALQEAMARIEQLEAKVAALESK